MSPRTPVACLWLLSCLLGPHTLFAQRAGLSDALPAVARNNSFRTQPRGPRLVTNDEGLSILGAALESRHHVNAHADCSHLVQAIYQRAGFPYAYSTSNELYEGTNEFRRISHPQPGDLVAWHGHVGIVINPTQHSFFSALRSGLGVEHYDSRYWRGRGHPRFLRYTKNQAPTVLAATKTASLRTTDSADENDQPAEDEPELPVSAPAEGTLTTSTETLATTAAPGRIVIPYVQLIQSDRPRPEQVVNALLTAFSATGESLVQSDLFKLPQPMIVFDKFEVKKVHLDGIQGWADVNIHEPSSLAKGQANLKKHAERQRLSLTRRDRATWEITLPPDAIYLPREIAVKILAHQLAALTDTTDPNAGEQKKTVLARLLNSLLEQPPAR